MHPLHVQRFQSVIHCKLQLLCWWLLIRACQSLRVSPAESVYLSQWIRVNCFHVSHSKSVVVSEGSYRCLSLGWLTAWITACCSICHIAEHSDRANEKCMDIVAKVKRSERMQYCRLDCSRLCLTRLRCKRRTRGSGASSWMRGSAFSSQLLASRQALLGTHSQSAVLRLQSLQSVRIRVEDKNKWSNKC